MKLRANKKQQGFTLVELIIVIVILGILAVTAAPRFLNLQGDARAGVIQGMAGAMQAASDLIRAKALVAGLDNGNGDVSVNGTDVDIANGYAVVDWQDAWDVMLEANIDLENDDDLCTDGFDFCVDETHDISGIVTAPGNETALIIYPSGTTRDDQCFAYYVHDESNNATTRPEIGAVTTGC